ncbi:hypothetical protein BMS3Bbin11_01851 [bacterium BMS3Bbin11]|nr:hypothetical protein BMS3Abin11_01786 [bacterium BMS3Abin11]GBE46750.1 hypothetical protein BMS3Bbin11_01851 [bacterium BMS3Bbin11]HDH08563.1 hypothetical protein [Gammaproteobacteria bacterium]HDZ78501.1 hypothetical protein [Gammaproteobacteria bacterium]
MKSKYAFISLSLALAILLSACSKPQTPLEVSQVFWQAVIGGNVADVVNYSTLGSEKGYDGFSRDWSGMHPSWGKIIIEEHEARVHTQISKPDASQSEMLYFVTYLVKQGDKWKVDYDRTEKAVLASSAVSGFVNRITTIGNEISLQFEEASKTVTAELESLNNQLIQLTESLGDQATGAVEEYSDIMRRHLDALASSIEKAINEQNSSINPADKKIMEETVTELGKSSKKLAQPDMNSIAETGEVIIITRKNLETLDAGTFQGYQAQWQQWINEVNVDLVNLLNEMSAKIK